MNKLKALLGFDPKTTTVKTELIAGMTTFLTMCYILAVNPTILATTGMDKGALFTATAIASAIAHLPAGFHGKVAFCPGSQHGTERLLRLHPLSGYGLDLAAGFGGIARRGYHLPSHYLPQYPR